MCYEASSPSFFWQIFIFVYLTILQIVEIILSFQTRRVKVQGLRDSKLVAAIIYISSIILIILALVTFSLRTYINIGTAIFEAGKFLLTTILLALIFISKIAIYVSRVDNYKDLDVYIYLHRFSHCIYVWKHMQLLHLEIQIKSCRLCTWCCYTKILIVTLSRK